MVSHYLLGHVFEGMYVHGQGQFQFIQQRAGGRHCIKSATKHTMIRGKPALSVGQHNGRRSLGLLRQNVPIFQYAYKS